MLPQRKTIAGAEMPSKLAGMLASGKRVIATAMRGSDLESVVSDVGVVVSSAEPHALALTIKELAKDSRKRGELRAKGRESFVKHWDRRQVLSSFSLQLEDLSREQGWAPAVSTSVGVRRLVAWIMESLDILRTLFG